MAVIEVYELVKKRFDIKISLYIMYVRFFSLKIRPSHYFASGTITKASYERLGFSIRYSSNTEPGFC